MGDDHDKEGGVVISGSGGGRGPQRLKLLSLSLRPAGHAKRTLRDLRHCLCEDGHTAAFSHWPRHTPLVGRAAGQG